MHKRARELADEEDRIKREDQLLYEKRARVTAVSRKLLGEAIERTKALANSKRIDTSVVLLAYMAMHRDAAVMREGDGALVLFIDCSPGYAECGATIRFLPSGEIVHQNINIVGGALQTPVDLLTASTWVYGPPLDLPFEACQYTRQETLARLCDCLDRAEPALRVAALAKVLPVADLPELVDSYVGPVSHDFQLN